MANSKNEQRPVRKLTVKNFSVIKEAELEFGNITVLIGPQASGKSLLCKLAYFLSSQVVATAVESLLDKQPWDEFVQACVRDFNSWFSTNGWLKTSFRACFSSQQYALELRGTDDPLKPEIEFEFGEHFKTLYTLISNNALEQRAYTDISRSELRQELWVKLSLLLNKSRTQAGIYIPSGRALFTNTSSLVAALQNPEVDEITRRFANQIAWDTRWKAGLLALDSNVSKATEHKMEQITGGVVAVLDGKPRLLSWDGRNLPLSFQSSGTQELLPMFNVLNYLAYHQEHFYARATAMRIPPFADISDHSPLIFLEEPEAHLFPSAQYELVQLFTWLSNDPILSFDWVVTTHSPYILSAFNNLIEAGQVAKAKPDLKDEVAKLIPEHFWINEGDFKAYAIEDGVLRSIVAEDTGLVSANYLDQVSETIGAEFDELLRLGYVES